MINANEMAKALRLTPQTVIRSPELNIENSQINRPGIQLTGFWTHFTGERPQVLGRVEVAYLASLDAQTRAERIAKFVSFNFPFILICRGFADGGEVTDLIEAAGAQGVPVFSTDRSTTRAMMELINYFNNQLAPRITRHGVLVDVYGVGMLITGNSGVGKSEAALELIKRGHRLVADDAVEIKRITDTRLIGEAPELVRNFMEIRGIGIIDVSTMYGISAVISTKSIDLVVHLEHWQQGKEYDRFGAEDQYTEILGVQIPRLLLPIHPGRNLAIVLEVAARNLRLKQQGYNAARELDRRLMLKLQQSADEGEEWSDTYP